VHVRAVAENDESERVAAEKADRRAARELVATYHREELGRPLDHVRQGFARLDDVEIDEFDLDEIIHRYKRAAAKLWSFCGSGGGQWQQAANTLRYLRDRNESTPDWWDEAGTLHR
jgi:hypothetical protein